MTSGVLLVDKPEGPTSHDMVDAVRRAYGLKRVGHTGTLDPFASGLLVLLVGRATRLARYTEQVEKRYEGTLRLGETTDTDDRTGVVTSTDTSWQTREDAAVADAMRGLTGTRAQRPPAYSAKKVRGTPAHRRVRRGEAVTLPDAEVHVHAFALLGRSGADVRFEAVVGSGTYIRALAREVGEALGCGAHLRTLRRTAIGGFRVEDALPGARIATASAPLLPMRALVRHLPTMELDAEGRRLVIHGRAVPLASPVPGPHALVSGDTLVAIAEPLDGMLRPRVVVVPDD